MQRSFHCTANEIPLLSITNPKSKLMVITQMYRSIMDRKYPVIKKCLLVFVSHVVVHRASPISSWYPFEPVREIAFATSNFTMSIIQKHAWPMKTESLRFISFFFTIILHGLWCIYLFIFIFSTIFFF